MRIDLHSHSNASDGTEPPADVVRRATEAGLDVLALTDHDTTAGWTEAVRGLPAGLTLVRGCEVSCAVTGVDGGRISVHLLAYLFDPTDPALVAELDLLRADRTRRAHAMVDRLVELGVPVDRERLVAQAAGGALGRPHIAEALVEAGVIAEAADAYTDEWIGPRGRAYVEKRALDPVAAIELVRGAGGAAVFAHPGAAKRGELVSDRVIAEMAHAGLAGLEADHPDHDPETRQRLRALAGNLGLLVTGSSDDHGTRTGHRLGCETTDPEVYAALIDGATGVAPVSA